MKMNLFMNPYQQPENKLTYSFLTLVDILNDREFIEWLAGLYLKEKPVISVDGVQGGGDSNPDGVISIKNRQEEIINIYIENKTNRRAISKEQLIKHLEWLDGCDKLLVITPRFSDKKIIQEMGNEKILFRSWPEIAEYLKKNINNVIAEQFVQYGKMSGEFEELGEITREEIETYIAFNKMNFDGKICSIFEAYRAEANLRNYGYGNTNLEYRDNWGRKGIEITPFKKNAKYGQWLAISLYYSTYDHRIEFLNDVPEIVFFMDVNPEYKQLLQNDAQFRMIEEKLVKVGFESNLDNNITKNKWRLMIYRKSISEFKQVNISQIVSFADEVFLKLKNANANEHPYFSDFAKQQC
jgi:hypothetical protein